ncbi:MAG: hypothetical protein FGM58_09535 [Acidimicrobiia bacterium]|nr:hypothetical protein [Acidimicrobiia bacterium]
MSAEHFVVLGVARARAEWLAAVGRWATASALPIEFIRCVSVDEVRARLSTDRRHSAVLLDERCVGVDRDLLGAAREAGCAPIIVCGSTPLRDWVGLGAAGTLTEPVDRTTLGAALREHAAPIDRGHRAVATIASGTSFGRLVTITGAGGTGTSLTAMALAAHFATIEDVALVDGALDADQALLHDLGDVLPGLPELVDVHRTSTPTTVEVRAALWHCPDHGYDVLPGLRRHRDWATMRRRNLAAAIASVRSAYGLVIADVDLDPEGETDTGSADVEDRNALSRTLLGDADVVVVTARPGISGVRRLLRNIVLLDEHGIELERVVPVIIGAPRNTARRSESTRAIVRLLDECRPGSSVATPVMVAIRRDLEPFLHDGAPLPPSVAGSVGAAVDVALRTVTPRMPKSDSPVRIVPGHLGRTA